ncbi:MAG: glycosyltransferase family 2 protein [Thermoplasmata archaeon]
MTVLVTSYNDERISNTLDSLSRQRRKPDFILVADGGTKWDIRTVCERYGATLKVLPGNVVQTRNKALEFIETELVAFIDTDEIAPEQWLEALIAPIERGEADFTGGVIKHMPPKSKPEIYMNKIEDYVYEKLVPSSMAYLPMGNSAWKMEIFRKIGGFDESIAGGGEDYDINLRALKSGFRGALVREAYLYHDHSDINTYKKLVAKRYSYLRATAKTYLKNKSISLGIRSSTGGHIDHPFYLIETMMKPLALADALIRN